MNMWGTKDRGPFSYKVCPLCWACEYSQDFPTVTETWLHSYSKDKSLKKKKKRTNWTDGVLAFGCTRPGQFSRMKPLPFPLFLETSDTRMGLSQGGF